MTLKIIKRREWFAEPEKSSIPTMKVPARFVLFSYTRKPYLTGKPSPGPRPTVKQIFDEVLYLQKGDLRKFSDIRYNFMIAPNGSVYEGRGWTLAPTLPIRITSFSFRSLYVGFIGDFKDHEPPKEMFLAAEELIKEGVSRNYISKTCCQGILQLPDTYKLDFSKYVGLS